MAASPLHVSPAGRATGSERGQTASPRGRRTQRRLSGGSRLCAAGTFLKNQKKTPRKKAVCPGGADSSSWRSVNVAGRADEAVRLPPARAWAGGFTRCCCCCCAVGVGLSPLPGRGLKLGLKRKPSSPCYPWKYGQH